MAAATTNLATDERQPLLVPPPLTADATVGADLGENGESPALNAALVAPPSTQRARWTPLSIACTALAWAAGIVVLVFLIKGFIEADDVEVRCNGRAGVFRMLIQALVV